MFNLEEIICPNCGQEIKEGDSIIQITVPHNKVKHIKTGIESGKPFPVISNFLRDSDSYYLHRECWLHLAGEVLFKLP